MNGPTTQHGGRSTGPVKGALAAAVTPLKEGGDSLDEGAFLALVDFLVGHSLDGILAMGTTGEGILLSAAERRRVTELFVAAAAGRVPIIAHCGAQTTRETVELAEHAAQSGAGGVAVIGPPYFALDDRSLVEHFASAARACAPVPFYLYEFAARSGYAVAPELIDRLRSRVDNLVGLKVSDAPFDRFAPYLVEGLDVFVGSEALISAAMEKGAAGAVSALASALPELVVKAVASGSADDSGRCARVRERIQEFPFHPALKRILGLRGVPIGASVRRPLRDFTEEEGRRFEPICAGLIAGLNLP
ncbi:MAG TPA: dihydrodipicolinate synthase family protein [Candidatus Acidoferrales bacterium]|nr:dihydrodipicolinate synthase family protein [Candidatus Acidoferrales bacterium]